jgi:hypothetical protein
MFDPEDVEVTTAVSPILYISALHQYLVNTDNKIMKQEQGAVAGSRDERLFQLLVQYVQKQDEFILKLEAKIEALIYCRELP